MNQRRIALVLNHGVFTISSIYSLTKQSNIENSGMKTIEEQANITIIKIGVEWEGPSFLSWSRAKTPALQSLNSVVIMFKVSTLL